MSLLKTSLLSLAGLLAVAYAAGQFTHRQIVTDIEIDAPPSTVWSVLKDLDGHSDWNPFIPEIFGTLKPGETLTVTLQLEGMSPMTMRPTVLAATPGQELRWKGKTGLPGIFDGEHYFLLSATERGTTRLVHGEVFSGMLTLPIFAMIGARTEAGFHALNQALKARVEQQR